MAYSTLIREELRKETGLKGIALAPFFAKRWAALASEEKAKLKVQYESEMRVWRVQMEQYKQTDAYANFQKKKMKKKFKKAPKDKNAPKRPSSAYFLYSNAVRNQVKAQLGSGTSVTDIAKKIGQQWKSMDATRKQSYLAQATEAKKNYDIRMSAYKQTAEYAQYAEQKQQYLKDKKKEKKKKKKKKKRKKKKKKKKKK